jgi:hypothetical protein
MRSQDVVIDEATYQCASLSCVQVDEMIFANVDLETDGQQMTAVVKGTKQTVRKRVLPALAASFNNALVGDAKWFLRSDRWAVPAGIDASKWTMPDAHFLTEMLYPDAMKLYDEIMILAKLRSKVDVLKKPVVKVQPEGEETAATGAH